MTNELEKQFFDTFGIKPNCKFVKYCDDCTKCGCYHYPRITPDILLELICIHLDWERLWYMSKPTIEELKEDVLFGLIDGKEKFYNQVRTLFEEG